MSRSAHARIAAFAAWTVWGALTLLLLSLVVHYGSNLPRGDEIEHTTQLAQLGGLDWRLLWQQHNEHRLPLAKLVYWALVGSTSDVRTPMIASVLLLSATAAALMHAARCVRGRSSFADVLFPLVWLQWTQAENLLSGFQIVFVIPAVLCGLALAWMVAARGDPARLGLVRFGAVLLLLPWCAIPGLLFSLPLAAWSLWAGWRARRSLDERERRAGTTLCALAAASLLLCALYFVGYERIAAHELHFDARRIVGSIGVLLARAAGWHVVLWGERPWVLVYAALLVVTLVVAVRSVRRAPELRSTLSAIAAVALGAVLVGAALGYGRSTETVDAAIGGRYATLSLPCFSSFACAWVVLGLQGHPWSRRIGGACATVATVTTAALWPANFAMTQSQARGHLLAGLRFQDDLRIGTSDADLAKKHWRSFYADEEGFLARLSALHAAHMPPFDLPTTLDPRGASRDDGLRLFFMFATQPSGYESARELVPRRSHGEWVLVAPAPTTLRFALQPELATAPRVLTARYGLLASAYDDRRFDGARFRVELVAPDGTVTTLFEQFLPPASTPEERAPRELSVEIAPGARGELRLVTGDEPGRSTDSDWCTWTAVAIR